MIILKYRDKLNLNSLLKNNNKYKFKQINK